MISRCSAQLDLSLSSLINVVVNITAAAKVNYARISQDYFLSHYKLLFYHFPQMAVALSSVFFLNCPCYIKALRFARLQSRVLRALK